MRIFFDINLQGGSVAPEDLIKLLDTIDQLMTGEFNYIVDSVDDHGITDTPTLQDLELRREEAPEGTPPDFLQDFTNTCEPD